MMHLSRPAFISTLLLVTIVGCQFLGGLNELQLAPGAGGAGGAGLGGQGGDASSASSTGSSVGAGGGTTVTAIWSKRFGDNTTQTVTDVAVDGSGNIFVVGYFLGTLDFGTGAALVTAGDSDAFLAKLDPDGNPLWSIRFGGTGPDRIESVGLTSNGDPIVGGSHGAPFSIGMTTIAHSGGLDAFLIRFSGKDGSLVWRNRFGDAQNQRCGSVSVNAGDDVYCLGDFTGTVAFGMQMFTNGGLEDVFAARFTSAGASFAALRAGDMQAQTGRCIVVNDANIAYAAARFDGKLEWGPVTSAGQGDVFLGKFNNLGVVEWALQMGDTNTQQPNGLALVGNTGGVALVGEFEGITSLGNKAVSSKGLFDAFVARVDAAGMVSWIRSIGDDPSGQQDDQYATDVAAMDDGTLFVTGYLAGTVDFGNKLISGPGDTDLFVMRLDPSGQTVWALRAGSDNSQFGRAIALSGTNELVVAGDFRTTLDLGNEPLVSAGSNDIFIAKLMR